MNRMIKIFIGILCFLAIFSCNNDDNITTTKVNGATTNTIDDGMATVEIRIHDQPFKKSGKTVTELNITVKEINIVNAAGDVIPCPMKEVKRLNILDIAKSNPVVLSSVSVPRGLYKQLRLVISDDSTIVVDGEKFDIKIPSGQQSGVKLDGDFYINNKFFRLDLDFKPEESVIYNKGQGYKMKPVIHISNTAEILGFFRGYLNFGDGKSGCETVVELNSDNSLRMKVSDYPDNIVYGSYQYNTVSNQLVLRDLKTDIPIVDIWGNVTGTERKNLSELQDDVPDPVTLGVSAWNPNEIITVSVNNIENKLYRVDNFNFSESTTFTSLDVTVKYPDNSKNGCTILTEVVFSGNGSPTITQESVIVDNGTVVHFEIPDSYLRGNSATVTIDAYLFDETSDYKRAFRYSGGHLTFGMHNSYIAEMTANPWQPPHTFEIVKSEKNKAAIEFPHRLNIKMNHQNWTDNNPVVTWDAYPGANNGYLVFVLVKDTQSNPNGDDLDGAEIWDIAAYDKVDTTEYEVFSNLISFTEIANSEFVLEPSIQSGDIIRVEVFVLDGSDTFSTRQHKGCLYMDSLNVVR